LKVELFYDRIKEILEMNEIERNEYGKLARSFVIENCSLEIWAEKWIKLIKNLIA
jgi:hypothetical protein